MINQALKINVVQPFAHYREPKVMQDDFIPSLLLPSKTTIAGLISYLVDRTLKSEFKIGIVGTYRFKEVHFIRGEYGTYWKKMRANINKQQIQKGDYDNFFSYYKNCIVENRIMNYEVLRDVNLIIFISVENKDDYKILKETLQKPRKYLSLGRKEDFIIPGLKGKLVEEVDLEEVEITDKKHAIREHICIKNTYMPVSLNDTGEENNKRLNSGVLYALPRTYKDLEADKKDRRFVYGHYVYIDDDGYFPSSGKVQVYRATNSDEPIVFEWL